MKSTGIFTPEQAKVEHKTSPKLAKALSLAIPLNRHVIDFGCGRGEYIKYLHQQGCRVTGYEGTEGMAEMTGFSKIKQADITNPIKTKNRGTVLCLEVLEHIPSEFTDVVIENLVSACAGRLIMSWAVKGQGGCGHVNEQDAEWVLGRFAKEGFTPNLAVSERLRKAGGSELWWFKKSIYVFDKIKR